MSSSCTPTFLELEPHQQDPLRSFFHVVPIPYDGTVCFQKGTAQGPNAILEVSDQIEHYDNETREMISQRGIATWQPLEPVEDPAEEMIRIENFVRNADLFRPDRFPIFLGGEHSITAPILRVVKEHYPEFTILQFDAHSDLRDQFGPAGRNSHACVMRRALELTDDLIQVGIRSFSEEDPVSCPEQVARFIIPEMLEFDFQGTLTSILSSLNKPVYISIDLDVFDPALAPGVGTPEPGGLSWQQVVRILRPILNEKQVIGADVVETMPIAGIRQTEFLAARLVGKLIAYRLEKE